MVAVVVQAITFEFVFAVVVFVNVAEGVDFCFRFHVWLLFETLVFLGVVNASDGVGRRIMGGSIRLGGT